jgi:hypothetical protein
MTKGRKTGFLTDGRVIQIKAGRMAAAEYVQSGNG